MKKIDISSKIAQDIKIDNNIASLMVNDILREISRHVDGLRNVSIRGFGKFSPKVYVAKTDVKLFNAEIDDLEKQGVFIKLQFKPGGILKNRVKDI